MEGTDQTTNPSTEDADQELQYVVWQINSLRSPDFNTRRTAEAYFTNLQMSGDDFKILFSVLRSKQPIGTLPHLTSQK